ncbi:costars family protein ABRACL isoform X1 [Dromaius novaehollandiae]
MAVQAPLPHARAVAGCGAGLRCRAAHRCCRARAGRGGDTTSLTSLPPRPGQSLLARPEAALGGKPHEARPRRWPPHCRSPLPRGGRGLLSLCIGLAAAAALPPALRGSRRRQRTTMNVEHEINLLVEEIRRLGSKNADGQVSVKFGVLFADEKCANLFEALVGTLKAAKRRKIVSYQGELLLQGVHDNVDIMLLQD